ncbi:hypothetical protein [Emticicia sp. C21]|uniref:hypothetical protein n=1 Tax=Emticicia sp. C21 TaxID=2302915 RepID=UPI000E34BD66|nr:hypothetical protein [Emticicia sp. C21]RFS18007.1 hypothetical protein D0T08_01825 [Emticicia sp. C21]
MTIQVSENYFTELYNKAIQGYMLCINNKENEFLKDEIGVPLESIQAYKRDIKIVFSKNFEHDHKFEATLNLSLSPSKNEIGRYTYVKDLSEEFRDEFLVFY